MNEEKTRPAMELFEQAMKNYEQALKTGLKLQEESTKWCMGLLNQSASPQDWQKKVKTVANEMIPQTQKSLDESLKLIEKNSKVCYELLKKASAAAQSTTPQEAQTKFLGFWDTSFSALREMAQTVTQANTKALDSWFDMVRKTCEPEPRGKA